jgi:hypothetical protein
MNSIESGKRLLTASTCQNTIFRITPHNTTPGGSSTKMELFSGDGNHRVYPAGENNDDELTRTHIEDLNVSRSSVHTVGRAFVLALCFVFVP